MANESVANHESGGEEAGPAKKKEPESEAGTLGLLVALLYGTGLATSNVYLSQFGIRDFSLVKPKALFAGAIVMGTIALIASGPLALISRFIGQPYGAPTLLKRNARGVAVLFVLPFAALFVITTISVLRIEGLNVRSWNAEVLHGLGEGLGYALGLFGSACATAILSIQILRKYRNIQHATSFSGIAKRLSNISLYVAATIVSLSIYVNLFCASLFESIPSVIGGPSNDTVQLQVQKGESASRLKNLGVQFNSSDDSLTTPMSVLYESEDQIYVFVPVFSTGTESQASPLIIKPGQPLSISPVSIRAKSRVLRLDKKLASASIVSHSEK